jgi:flagellar hook-associated protein 2
MPITASGIGSGLDINGLVSQLIAVERQPLALLNQRESRYQAQLSAYGSLKGAISAFQTSMSGLANLARYQGVTSSVADTTIASVSANAKAVPGDYALEVKQLAQAQKLVSGSFTNVSDPVGTGTLTIQFGGMVSGDFTLNPDLASVDITINNSNSGLSGIRDAINAADTDVRATLLNDGSGHRLVLTSKSTGLTNGFRVLVTDTSDASNTDNAGLSRLAFDPEALAGSGKNMTEMVSASDSIIKLDGIDNISHTGNVLTDVIEGVTLTLKKKSETGVATTLTLQADKAGTESAVRKFVSAYNELNNTVSSLTAYNADRKQGSILQGDSSALLILSRLRSMAGGVSGSASAAYTSLSQAGISFQSNGQLAVNETRLQEVLSGNPADLAALFANTAKATDSLVSYVSSSADTREGMYSVVVNQLASRGVYTGSTVAALADTTLAGTFDAPLVIDSTNDTLAVKVNGVQGTNISLGHGSYTTAAQLVAELQSRINGTSELQDAGITVTVEFDSANDRLTIRSDRYGAESRVDITAVDPATASSLGLAVATGAAGVDVSGSIGGVVASGAGQVLTGADGHNSEGLAVMITGGATGVRGSVTYRQGMAYRFSEMARQLLDDDGILAARTEGINRSIDNIKDKRDSTEARLELVEARIRAQFTALDTLMSRLSSTSTFLTNQLASLSNKG